MGRGKENAVHHFYSYDTTANVSICIVCKTKIKGCHAGNLLHHMSAKHKVEYKIIMQKNSKPKRKTSTSGKKYQDNDDIHGDASETSDISDNPPGFDLEDQYATLDKDLVTENTRIADDKTTLDISCNKSNEPDSIINKIRKHCIDLVIVHGRPFGLFEDEAFKNILKLTKAPLQDLQTITSNNIKDLIIKAAKEKREKISLEWKDKLVCIKIDSITHQNRLFLGINAQYLASGQITIRHLGIAEVVAPINHDSQKEIILQIIGKYNLNVEQVYSITSDDRKIQDNKSKMDVNTTTELEIVLEKDILNISPEHSTDRCVAYCLKIAVDDALRDFETQCILKEVRNIVCQMQSDTLITIFKTNNKKSPILDSSSHFRFTLAMLEKLFECREYYSTKPGVIQMPVKIWKAIQDIIKALTPAAKLAENLESEQYTVGDFFYGWMKCHLETGKVAGHLAGQICEQMEKQKQNFMRNKTFLSALYLDPRFRVVLSAEQMPIAVDHLNATWLRLLSVEAKTREEPVVEIKKDPDDEMEVFLELTECEKRQEHESYYIQSQANIGDFLINFSRHPRISAKDNILKFWHDKKMTDPQLSRLANTVLATPTTHASVECLLSSLKFSSSFRHDTCKEVIEDILVLKNNLF